MHLIFLICFLCICALQSSAQSAYPLQSSMPASTASGDNEYAFIPNAFTPNGDGVNDNFFIQGSTPGTHFIIFNRRGLILYENTGTAFSWDGSTDKGGSAPPDIYFYSLTNSANNVNESGTILLIR